MHALAAHRFDVEIEAVEMPREGRELFSAGHATAKFIYVSKGYSQRPKTQLFH